MFITFSWPKGQGVDNLSMIAKEVSRVTAVVPTIGGTFPQLLDQNVLSLRTEGLGAEFPLYYMVNAPYWQKVEEVVASLRNQGIEPLVLVNGSQSLLAYAAQEEIRARYLRRTLKSVRWLVGRTSRWVRDSRIASIRLMIDSDLEKEEGIVTFKASSVSVK